MASGWSELGAALAGGDSLQRQKLAMAGYQGGSRQARMLEDAATIRDKNLGLQSITPELVGSVVSGRDPVTGQAFVPEAMDSLQGQLLNGMLHGGIDPRELSGYQKDRQAIGFGDRAMEVATAPDADLNLLNRINMVRSGRPVNLSTIQDGTLLSAMVTPDQQAAVGGNTPTQVGLADIMAKGAQANAFNGQASAANAHARLFDKQTSVGGFNPRAGGEGATTPPPMADPNGTHGDAYLSAIDPTIAAQVKALSEGRMAFPTGTALKSPYWQGMLQHVAQYDPSFDAVNYNARAGTRKDFTSGKAAQTVNALNTVAEHLGTLSDYTADLNNTSFQPWNRFKNATAAMTGDPDIAKFNTAKKAVADEVAKVWRSTGGSQMDIEENLKNLDASQSPAQLNAAIGTLTKLIAGKVAALQDQYRAGMGTTQDLRPLVSPEAKHAFDKTTERSGLSPTDFGGISDMAPAGPAIAPQAMGAAPAQPAHAGGYQRGQVINVGGKQYRVVGGDPNDPDLEAL